MAIEKTYNNPDRISQLITESLLETDKLILRIQKILAPFRNIESFKTSLDTEKGKDNFKKKIESILRKAESYGKTTQEFIKSGECNDLNRIELVLSESNLYNNDNFFKCLDEILNNLDSLGIYMLEDPRTELVRRPNGYSSNHLVFQLPNGQTLEIQILPEGTFYGKQNEDDECYRPAQNICSQLTEFQSSSDNDKLPEMRPSIFYELLSHGNDNQQIMQLLKLDNNAHVNVLIDSIKIIFEKSKAYYGSIDETYEFDAKLQNRIDQFTKYSKLQNKAKQLSSHQQKLQNQIRTMRDFTEAELFELCHS
jgi:hypothetical protein